MTKLSINAASKLFSVSRPTILKHLQSGKVSGKKDTETGHWLIDQAELARVYPLRANANDNLPANVTHEFSGLHGTLQAENERLKSELALASALADERGKRLDQLAPLLVDQRKRKRGWWPW